MLSVGPKLRYLTRRVIISRGVQHERANVFFSNFGFFFFEKLLLLRHGDVCTRTRANRRTRLRRDCRSVAPCTCVRVCRQKSERATYKQTSTYNGEENTNSRCCCTHARTHAQRQSLSGAKDVVVVVVGRVLASTG